MPALQGQAAQEALCPQRRRSIKMLIRGSKLLQKSHLSSPPYADPRPSPSLPITVLCTADSAFRLTWAAVPKSPTPCKAASHPGPAPLGLGAGLCATPLGLQDRAETGVKSVSDGGEDEDCSPIEIPGTNSPKMLHSSSGALGSTKTQNLGPSTQYRPDGGRNVRALEIREAQTLATEEPQRSSATRRRGEAAGSKQGQSEGRRPGFLPTPPAWLAAARPPNSTLCLSLFTINTGVHVTFGFSIANQRGNAPHALRAAPDGDRPICIIGRR